MAPLHLHRHDGDPVRHAGEITREWCLDSARLRAARVVECGAGVFAVLDPSYPNSYDHNKIVTAADADGIRLTGLADEVLGGAGLAHRQVDVYDEVSDSTVEAFRREGYDHDAEVLMACTPDPAGPPSGSPEVHEVPESVVAPTVEAMWRRVWLPDADDASVRDLVERRRLLDVDATVHRLAVLDHAGTVAANADLVIRSAGTAPQRAGGPVAELDGVETLPEHRGHGFGDAIVARALQVAAEQGAVLVVLTAMQHDWPREWYARRGFAEVGPAHSFTRRPPGIPATGGQPTATTS